MRARGQENNSLVRQVFAKAILAFGHEVTLLAANKDDTEVAIHPRAATAAQIQRPGRFTQELSARIRISKHPIHAAFNLRS